MKASLLIPLALVLGASATATTVNVSSSLLELLIPDDSNTGLSVSLDVAESFAVDSVRVTLDVSVPVGSVGWVGDLYAYVQHDSGLSVLLNRPGRDTGSIAGYPDSQDLRLAFEDTGGQGDIHTYRLSLFGDEGTGLSGALEGVWEPDGRITDPALVLTGDSRQAPLAAFNGLDAAGHPHRAYQ